VELADLDGSNGFVINGIDDSDYSGRSVSAAGDINGDGIDDVIIGVDGADPRNSDRAGESYVVFGHEQPFASSLELSTLDGTNGFMISGIGQGDRSGYSASAAGDVNGEGIDDLIVGAISAAPGGNPSAGQSYVVFGQVGPFPANVELSALDGSNGFVINGIGAFDYSGTEVSAAGDINGDGIGDVIIGSSFRSFGGVPVRAGNSYVVFGKMESFASSLELSALDGANGFVINGVDDGDRLGTSVSGAGDVNADGIDDVIVGAPFASPGNNSSAGESYVIFGHTGPFEASLELSTLDGGNGFVINGIDADDRSGYSVSAAGDVNGDGADDVVIGAAAADPGGNVYAGESYVVFGQVGIFPASVELTALDGSNGFVINGIDAIDFSGISVSAAGDVNGDGIDDVIIGASVADPGGRDRAGESYVVFGHTEPFAANLDLSALDGASGFVINGIDEGDISGLSVSAAGDVNGDEIDDVIIGAFSADPGGRYSAGESYVVFGTFSPKGRMLNLVDIDIKPGDRRNVVNPRAKGGIWVAVHSDTLLPFDPLQIDIPRVQFGPEGAKAIRYRVKDVNKDGIEDLILRFRIRDSGIGCGDTKAKLKGRTFDGQRFRGKDAVKTVGCEVKSPHWKNHGRKKHNEQ
jgi:hypothetical protein